MQEPIREQKGVFEQSSLKDEQISEQSCNNFPLVQIPKETIDLFQRSGLGAISTQRQQKLIFLASGILISPNLVLSSASIGNGKEKKFYFQSKEESLKYLVINQKLRYHPITHSQLTKQNGYDIQCYGQTTSTSSRYSQMNYIVLKLVDRIERPNINLMKLSSPCLRCIFEQDHQQKICFLRYEEPHRQNLVRNSSSKQVMKICHKKINIQHMYDSKSFELESNDYINRGSPIIIQNKILGLAEQEYQEQSIDQHKIKQTIHFFTLLQFEKLKHLGRELNGDSFQIQQQINCIHKKQQEKDNQKQKKQKRKLAQGRRKPKNKQQLAEIKQINIDNYKQPYEHRNIFISIQTEIWKEKAAEDISIISIEYVTSNIITSKKISVLTKRYKKYDQAIADRPKNHRFYHMVALNYENLKDYVNALYNYDLAIQTNSQYPQGFIRRGYLHYLMGNYQSSIRDFQQAFIIDPSLVNAINGKAIAYGGLKDYEKAISLIEEALTIDPLDVDSLHNMGIILKLQKKFQKSLQYFQRQLQILKCSRAYISMALVYQQMKDYTLSLQCYDKAVQVNPNNPNIYYNKILLYQQENKVENIIQTCDTLIKINSDEAQAHLIKAKIYYKNKHFLKAMKDYHIGLSLIPYNEEIQDQIQKIIFKLQQNPNIFQQIRIQTDAQNNSQNYYYLGLIYAQLSQDTLAQDYYKKSLLRKPNNDAYLAYADILMDKQDYCQALKHIKDAPLIDFKNQAAERKKLQIQEIIKQSKQSILKIDQQNLLMTLTDYDQLYYQGKIYMIIKDYQKALKFFDRVIQLEPQHVSAFLQRIKIHKQKQEYTKSLQNFNILIKQLQPRNKSVSSSINIRQSLYKQRGYTYFQQEDYQSAFQDFTKAKKLASYPQNYDLEFVSCYIELQQYQQAKQLYDGSSTIYSNYSLSIRLARMNIALKEYRKALEYLNRELEQRPSDNLLYYYRGIVYQQSKQYKTAIVNYKKAVKKGEKKIDAYAKLAQIQYKVNQDYQKAQEYCNKALQIDQNHIQARFNLAMVYFSQESYQKSLKEFDIILEPNPTNKKPLIYSQSHFYRGQINHKQQKYEKAAQNFKSALSYRENHPIYLIKLVECYKRLNDVEALSKTVDLCKKICSVGVYAKLLLEFELKQTDLEEIRAKINQFESQMQSYKQK